MKLHRLLLVTGLATVVALVPRYGRSETGSLSIAGDKNGVVDLDPTHDALELPDKLAEQLYFEDPYVTPGFNSTHKSAPAHNAAVSPPNVTGWNTTTSVEWTTRLGGSSNSLLGPDAPSIAGFPSNPSFLNARIRIGMEKQHIGTLRKNRLENTIFECLKRSCPLDDPQRGLNPCTSKNTESCQVNNIVYNAEPHDKYATNSHITVQVDYAYHNPVWKGLGETAYRAVASVYRIMSDMQDGPGDDGTIKIGACQPVDFPGSRKTWLCNVPRSASVAFPVNDDHPKGDAGEIQAMVAVSIYFNGKTTDGDYNVIPANQRSREAIFDKFDREWKATIAKEIDRPERDIGIKMDYLDSFDKCQAWFWYEDAKCKA